MSEAPEMKATQREMSDARIPIEYRDYCAHLLIPLNKCRTANYYLPWKCGDERHEYEKCQYQDYMRRMRALDKARLEEEQE
ncbi:NADH dehydrogenase [ubiquinone] 1 beta subcomplex subunit 7 [Bifiguratus adelaidae]|uniref:NADH dehydrogenase [ubiquinone] 1 beta subcomplex subunit 7 n=1 Tax=Bifiguratus adelaidae TaxID=1938954 RepID=A0A261XZN6_9FUNG|nr:NADH dehydrogenase [ubiquinone] 1 beta subcomplex subunit 7 [Bifiguratus adelaidae]